ncbi:MAG: hypothetical protein COC08_00550 [Maribacter sp.]|nr:MAG: hypothetical protein COC08_08360 [Maribacter sp.]PHQ62530.1 MAG: hypothetical protein COC08_00550 [Maribacter sp.]
MLISAEFFLCPLFCANFILPIRIDPPTEQASLPEHKQAKTEVAKGEFFYRLMSSAATGMLLRGGLLKK